MRSQCALCGCVNVYLYRNPAAVKKYHFVDCPLHKDWCEQKAKAREDEKTAIAKARHVWRTLADAIGKDRREKLTISLLAYWYRSFRNAGYRPKFALKYTRELLWPSMYS